MIARFLPTASELWQAPYAIGNHLERLSRLQKYQKP